MRYLSLTALLLNTFTLFAQPQSPIASNGQDGQEKVVRFFTLILPSYEVPPVFPSSLNPEVGAFGVASPRLFVTTDQQGTITQVRAQLKFTLCGLPGQSITFRKVDIHGNVAGQRGATIIDTAVSDANPLTLTVEDGCVSDSLPGVAGPGTNLTDSAAQIIKNPAGFYFEVHTIPNNPTGLARGQLAPRIDD